MIQLNKIASMLSVILFSKVLMLSILFTNCARLQNTSLQTTGMPTGFPWPVFLLNYYDYNNGSGWASAFLIKRTPVVGAAPKWFIVTAAHTALFSKEIYIIVDGNRYELSFHNAMFDRRFTNNLIYEGGRMIGGPDYDLFFFEMSDTLRNPLNHYIQNPDLQINLLETHPIEDDLQSFDNLIAIGYGRPDTNSPHKKSLIYLKKDKMEGLPDDGNSLHVNYDVGDSIVVPGDSGGMVVGVKKITSTRLEYKAIGIISGSDSERMGFTILSEERLTRQVDDNGSPIFRVLGCE